MATEKRLIDAISTTFHAEASFHQSFQRFPLFAIFICAAFMNMFESLMHCVNMSIRKIDRFCTALIAPVMLTLKGCTPNFRHCESPPK